MSGNQTINLSIPEEDKFIKMNKRRKIISIDETKKNDSLIDLLSDAPDFDILQFTDLKESLNYLNENHVDFIFVDFNFLIKGKYVTWIKKIKETNTILFVIKDEKSDYELCKELLFAGIDDFISRPFCRAELNHRIALHTRLHSKRNTIENLKKNIENLEEENSNKLIKMYDDLQLAYKELELRKKELESLDKAKSDFIKIVSHEIRSPLSGILGFSQLLESKLPGEYNNYISSLNQSALRLQEFSNKAIMISQIKTNSYKLKNEPISVLHLVNSIIEKYDIVIQQKKLNVRNNLSHRLINTDFSLYEKALTHIIDNAIRYAPEKTYIFIEELYAYRKFSVMVIDQGPGFSEEVFNNIFGLFVHGEKYIDKNVGLGLYMVKLIMNYLGGNARVANNKEGGALVKLIFPIKEKKDL